MKNKSYAHYRCATEANMSNLNQEQIARVKGMGFLRNRGTDCFSGRVVPVGTVFSAADFRELSYIAEHFGNGKLICTSRQSIEIPEIPYELIDEVVSYAEAHGIFFGGTGAKVRPVTACKGTTCVYGTFDTQALAAKIHHAYYLGWRDVQLPHKFKIAVGGCPNSCIKPSLNDFGVEGHRGIGHGAEPMYQIYIGGTWGKRTRMGTPLSCLVREEEVLPILEKTMLWFRENAYAKERLGLCVDRLGADVMEKALFSDDLLDRKGEILAAAIKQR